MVGIAQKESGGLNFTLYVNDTARDFAANPGEIYKGNFTSLAQLREFWNTTFDDPKGVFWDLEFMYGRRFSEDEKLLIPFNIINQYDETLYKSNIDDFTLESQVIDGASSHKGFLHADGYLEDWTPYSLLVYKGWNGWALRYLFPVLRTSEINTSSLRLNLDADSADEYCLIEFVLSGEPTNISYQIFAYGAISRDSFIYNEELTKTGKIDSIKLTPGGAAAKHTVQILWPSKYRDAKYKASFEIELKATASTLSFNPSSLSLDASNPAGTVAVLTNSDGAISVSSDDTSIASAAVSDRSIRVSSTGTAGSTTINVTVAATSTHAEASGSFTVTYS